ncbi:MAG: serine/threonine protein kinase [Arenicella sp.]
MTLLMDYGTLTPETVLNAIETTGLRCDGRLQALNSFENRVYLIGLDDGTECVAKFYRPERWTDQDILEEHSFTQELEEAEIPVVSPTKLDGQTLFNDGTFRFSLFPKRGGRAPDLENFDTLEQLGRFVARIHQVGRSKAFTHRPSLSLTSYGENSREFLLQNDFIPNDLLSAYDSLSQELLTAIGHSYERAGDIEMIRNHSDFHPGNILWTDEGPHIVDFDDARMAPACQDLWMFLSGDRADMTAGLDALLEGYTQFCNFNARELHLIEALRTLRLMHYYAWLAKRWDDPAFKIAFPWFNTQQCWEQHILSLREQAAIMYEEPLTWFG